MQAQDSLSEKQRRFITSLFKHFLEMLSTIKAEHDEFYSALAEKMPEEYLTALYIGNPMTDDKFKRLRKQILDKGNDIIRDSDMELNNFSISFKF